MYCLFNLSKRFSLSQHNASASVVRRCCSRKLGISFLFVFRLFGPFAISLSFHFRCGAVDGVWCVARRGQKLFVLNHIANDARVAIVSTKYSIFYLYPIVYGWRTFYCSFLVLATTFCVAVYSFTFCLRLFRCRRRLVKQSAADTARTRCEHTHQ